LRAVGYARVSTEEQGRSGLGLEAQRSAIVAECGRRGWRLAALHAEVASGGRADNRPLLGEALAALGRGDALVVSRLDRLTRSLPDFADLLRSAGRRGWNLVALDMGLDLATPTGRAMAGMAAVFAQWEREMIGLRISEALAAKRAGGWVPPRPAHQTAEADEARVLRLRRCGLSQRGIAAALSEEDGRTWHRETVARVLRREALGSGRG
jgi:DNA invertase Pin-like site-specific DNA recombinase